MKSCQGKVNKRSQENDSLIFVHTPKAKASRTTDAKLRGMESIAKIDLSRKVVLPRATCHGS